MTLPSLTHARQSMRHVTTRSAAALVLAMGLAACGESIVAPTTTPTPHPTIAPHAAVVVTSSYSTFDTRPEFNSAASIDQLNPFDEFSGDLVYIQSSPWTTHGVTYTSGLNIVLGPGVGLGVQSNALSTEFGAPLTGTFADADAITTFGVDLTLIGVRVPVGLVLFTNLGSYSFTLDTPLATSGRRFFGIALANAGEHLTGFRFTVTGTGTGLLIDDVAIGHVAVHNAAPDASSGGPYTGAEGSEVSLELSATDADNDALTYDWDFGDGTVGSGATPPASHTYADNGTYAIMLAVSDGRGGVDTARTTATISNVAPTLAAFTVPTAPLPLAAGGVTLPISSTFTDPGTADTHTATLDCGVGAPVQSAAPNGTAGGQCTFTSPGVYAIQLSVSDDDGGSDMKVATGQVVVYDASAGWVTGGGWIASPAGALAASPTTAAKLTFGFVARYQAMSTTPSGNAEFKLSVGKLDFRSTSLDWLVVGESTAQLQGRGTLNGSGDYSFAVVAVDGEIADAIRIRIWNRATGALVYDNRVGDPLDATTPLSGGSVQLHDH
jgi:PKD repeat protein